MTLSLGTDHDNNLINECNEWNNYIMATKFYPYNQKNSWFFQIAQKIVSRNFCMI